MFVFQFLGSFFDVSIDSSLLAGISGGLSAFVTAKYFAKS